jgi:hypothetical protein
MGIRRALLLAVAVLLTVSALLAVAILLFGGDFGRTEGRILGTTAMLAGYAVLGLPAAALFDRGLARPLAALDGVLAGVGAALAAIGIWSGTESEAFGKSIATVTIILAAVALASLLTARRSPQETVLYAASLALAAISVAIALTLLWLVEDDATLARILGATVVLTLLTSALQPILGRARNETHTRLRLHLADGTTRDVSVRGSVERVDLL